MNTVAMGVQFYKAAMSTEIPKVLQNAIFDVTCTWECYNTRDADNALLEVVKYQNEQINWLRDRCDELTQRIRSVAESSIPGYYQ